MATNKRKPARDRRHRKGLKIRIPSAGELDRRTRAFQMVRETQQRLANDLGGHDALSEMQLQLIGRVAVIDVVLTAAEASWIKGDDFDLSGYTTAANTQNRLLASLGLKRVARDVTPDLAVYLQHKAASAEQVAAA